MPPAARDLYTATVTALTLSLGALGEPHTLTFAPDAAAGRHGPSRRRSSPGSGPARDLAHMTDWGGKLAGAIIRIAGLLHLAEHARDGWDRPITLATLEAAAEIGDYFTHHAKAAYDTIGADPATAAARAILQWLTTTRPAQVTDPRPHARHAAALPQGRRPRRPAADPRITRLDTRPPRPPRSNARRRTPRLARMGRTPRHREPAMTRHAP